jgi:hypothetical protein
MKKPKKPKPPRPKPPPPSPPPLPPQTPRPRHFGAWIAGSLALIASVFGIILFFDWVRDQYAKTDPEIAIVDSDPASPFLFPFSVRNESPFFSMTEVNWACSISRMEAGNGFTMDNVSVGFMGSTKEIVPRTATNLRCPLRAASPVAVLKIRVSIDYKSMGKPRHTEKPFTWVAAASRPRWIEGE